MTQTISTDTIKRFRKAFPEIQKEEELNNDLSRKETTEK
jgi:hypothetical protein